MVGRVSPLPLLAKINTARATREKQYDVFHVSCTSHAEANQTPNLMRALPDLIYRFSIWALDAHIVGLRQCHSFNAIENERAVI
jgi:hypothetical protein